jgi:DnaJ-domain-containing protein 1
LAPATEAGRAFGCPDWAPIEHQLVAEQVEDTVNPYEVLGVAPEIDNEALRIHYRKLIADHHPDAMIARGLPPGFVTIATKKNCRHQCGL